MNSPPHVEVAAYILGVLNQEDSEAFDLHLLDCASCQEELRDMYELPDALNLIKSSVKGTVNGAARGTVNGTGAGYGTNGAAHGVVNGSSPTGVVRDLWSPQSRPRGSVSGHRRTAAPDPRFDEFGEARNRRRRVTWLAVAAALAIGVTGAATAQLWPSSGSQTIVAAPPTGSVKVEVKEGTSPDTGVSGSVGMAAKSWGTEVFFQLSGVTGPERCSLIAISSSGDTDVVSGWRVPSGKGFGVAGFPDPLKLTGGTALSRTEIVRFEVRRDDGVRLLEIPIA